MYQCCIWVYKCIEMCNSAVTMLCEGMYSAVKLVRRAAQCATLFCGVMYGSEAVWRTAQCETLLYGVMYGAG